MYLKSLELTGFKSFAKKASLDFTSAISAIVGPNGSGKSNIAEAFRFVLGEQSMKSMRGKKGEDLIWNGSGDTARANRASVKVVFDNRKRFLNIDFDEVTIERVVHRDSVNEYSINGSQVRLRDVIELLAGAHIGASGHHIISQGEADKILNANLRDRRAMIEDALGLKIYQYKKQESERKLEKTEENIASVEGLRKEVAPHLRFLKKQVEKVEKTLAMKDELLGLYKEYFWREDKYLKDTKAARAEERAPLQKDLHSVEQDLAEAKKILENSKGKDEKSTHIVSLEEKIRKARDEKDSLMRDLGRLEGEIAAEERIIKKQKEIAQSVEGKTINLREVEIFTNEIDEQIDSATSENDISKIKTAFSAIKNLIKTFISKHRTQTNSAITEESKEHVADLNTQKKSIESDIKELESVEKSLQKEYTELKTEIEREKDTNREAERNMFTLMSQQNDLRNRLSVIHAAEATLHLEEENFKREMGEAAVLVGRAVLDFATHTGNSHDSHHTHEPRSAQEERRRAIEKIKIRIEDAGGGAGDDIMKEYKEVSERDAFLERELADLEKSAVSLKQLITELDARLTAEFKSGVEKINTQFQHFFALMFGGGSASLSIVREKKRRRADTDISGLLTGDIGNEDEMPQEEEEAEEGIDISVSLPRKKIKGLVMLSGGERALTSIALLFAMSQVNPPPFIILDETDAALDEANSRKYGDMIENLSKYSQLILITHNRETMSRAGILYGVTMASVGGSKLLSIEFEEAVAVAK